MAMRIKTQRAIDSASKRKPLKGRKYFLHVNVDLEEKLTKKIAKLGGTVADVLDNVYAVITDDCSGKMFVKYSLQQESRTRTSSSPANPESATTPVAQCAADSAYGTLSSSSRQRLSGGEGKFQRTNSSELLSTTGKCDSVYFKMPSILRQAVDLHIKLVTTNDFFQLVEELESKFVRRRLQLAESVPQKITANKKMDTLRAPCFKFEDEKRLYCPVYKQFTSWPIIYIRPGAKGSPFERRSFQNETSNECKKKVDNASDHMTKSRPKNLKVDFGGYCELCRYYADNLNNHLDSEFHNKRSIGNNSFKNFDKLISQGRTLDQFVESLLAQPESAPCEILTSTPEKCDFNVATSTICSSTSRVAACHYDNDLKELLDDGHKTGSFQPEVGIGASIEECRPLINVESACVSHAVVKTTAEQVENKSILRNNSDIVSLVSDKSSRLSSESPKTPTGKGGPPAVDAEQQKSPVFMARRIHRYSPNASGSKSIGKRKLTKALAGDSGTMNVTIENIVC